jgi:3-phenylpropionate/cinnamic acid dioxygenase small subunit
MTVEELLAREAIRDLVARYHSFGDAGRFDQLFELFADDIVMELRSVGRRPAVHTGIDEVRAIFTGTSDRVLDRDTGRDGSAVPYIRHHHASHRIDVVDADHATGRSYFAVIAGVRGGPGGLDHWGRYTDEYVRRGGRWLFRRRQVVTEGHAEGGWFAAH